MVLSRTALATEIADFTRRSDPTAPTPCVILQENGLLNHTYMGELGLRSLKFRIKKDEGGLYPCSKNTDHLWFTDCRFSYVVANIIVP